jgi:hypothetical protein
MEVCLLSHGVMSPFGSTPIRPITGRHSLSPSSFTRSPFGSPFGSLSLSGRLRAYYVPREYHDGLDPAYSPVAVMSAAGSTGVPAPTTYLLVQACQHLWLVVRNDVYQRFTCVGHTIGPSSRTALMLAVVTFPHGRVTTLLGEATFSRGLSHHRITPTARLGRALVAEHQAESSFKFSSYSRSFVSQPGRGLLWGLRRRRALAP